MENVMFVLCRLPKILKIAVSVPLFYDVQSGNKRPTIIIFTVLGLLIHSLLTGYVWYGGDDKIASDLMLHLFGPCVKQME